MFFSHDAADYRKYKNHPDGTIDPIQSLLTFPFTCAMIKGKLEIIPVIRKERNMSRRRRRSRRRSGAGRMVLIVIIAAVLLAAAAGAFCL